VISTKCGLCCTCALSADDVTHFDRMAESLESRKYDNSRSKRGIASASSLSGSEFTGKRIDGGGASREVEVSLFSLQLAQFTSNMKH
jgi:hypothetical protein